MINLTSMVDEYSLITKQAKKWEPINKTELKQLAKNVAVYGTGIGVGIAGSDALLKALLPKVLPHKKLWRGLATASGGILGLATAAAMSKNLQLLREAREKNAS